MKPMFALTGVALILCSLAHTQEPAGDRVVVPARNSTRPRKLDLQLLHGSVQVKAYNGKDVIVETGSSRRADSGRTVNGMRRIDLPPRGLVVEEQDNVITVRTGAMSGSANLLISVPPDTSVTARTHNGNIEIEGLRGEFDLESSNGPVTLTGVSGTVIAHSMNGPIKVSMDRVDPSKPLSFSTMNGAIDVVLPADWKANVKLTTNHGEIWSDFDFKLGGGAVTQPNNTPDGRFRVTIDRTIVGTVNGGGPEATFRTFNGRISIKKK